MFLILPEHKELSDEFAKAVREQFHCRMDYELAVISGDVQRLSKRAQRALRRMQLSPSTKWELK